MALFGGDVKTIPYQSPDYSGSVDAARGLANARAQGIAGGIGQVTDYFKQQGEKKKLIKQSDIQIDAALKLFPEMSSVLQPYKDQIRDENVSLDERSFIAGQTGDFITNSLNMMKMKSTMELAREREARIGANAVPAPAEAAAPTNAPIVW